MYKVEIQLESVEGCPKCNHLYIDKKFTAMRSQNGEYIYDTPLKAFQAFGMAYGVLDWQSKNKIDTNCVYGGIDSYGRSLNFRIVPTEYQAKHAHTDVYLDIAS